MKIVMIIIQFIFCVVLLVTNFDKKHFLLKGIKYEAIHELPFNPVYEIYLENKGIGIYDYLVVNTLNDRKFSLIKTEKYSKKCLDNYYINSELECPITQIYLENEKSYIYSSFHELIIKGPIYKYSDYTYYNLGKTQQTDKYIYYVCRLPL